MSDTDGRRDGGGPGRTLRVAIAVIVLAATSWVVHLVVTGVTSEQRPGAQGTPGGRTTTASGSPAPAGPTAAGSGPAATGTPAPVADRQRQRLDACANALLSRMPIERQVGQLLFVGTRVDSPQDLLGALTRYGLGGVFLAGRSTAPAPVHARDIQRLRSAASAAGMLPPHVAVDQEGGQVQTLQGTDFPPIPPATEQGNWAGAVLRDRTLGWARRLAAVGITVDFAPVADTVPTGTAAWNPPIGAYDRQYGSDPDAVAADVATVVTAVQQAGVLVTLKHFPGLGRVRANTDTSDAAVDAVTSPGDPYLRPFLAGIRAGAAGVMMSSASYPRLDASSVAAFSAPVVTGLLRQRMGYSGLVISDDLGAAAAVSAVPAGERAVRFVRAGGDMVLTVRSGDAAAMSAALVAAAHGSAAFRARVTEAARHVIVSKYRARLLSCTAAR